MGDISTILWTSIAFQVLAVLIALHTIRITGRAMAWILLSAAFLLMALRRSLELLHQQGIIGSSITQVLTTELVALIISVLIFLGVLLIRKMFTDRKSTEEQLLKLSLAVEQNPTSTLITDKDGNIEYANPIFLSRWGLGKDQVIGRSLNLLRCQETASSVFDQMWLTITHGNTWRGEICRRDKHAHLSYEKVTISPCLSHHDGTTHFVALFEDITESKTQRKALEQLALHDSLTSLPNRQLFADRVEQAIRSCERTNEALSVLMIGLDRFKDINDTLGHHVGDLVLKEASVRLQYTLRRSDTVARMGGDEFLMLLTIDDPTDCDRIAKKIQYAMEQPLKIEGYQLHIGISIGIAMYPEHGQTAGTLIQKADVAMFAAKQTSSGYSVYHHAHDQHSSIHLEIASELRYAIDNGDMVLHYQPKVNAATHRCVGFEALVRWNHPVRGLAHPDTFIEIAEHTGHIKQLTHWVLKHTMQQCVKLSNEGHHFDMSVNISGRYFQDPDFVKDVTRILEETGAEPTMLILELTESVLMTDVDKAVQTLRELDEMGVRLSIDDFGTGYSSLEYLKRFPVDELKIDKSFVLGMMLDENDAVIVRSTIDLAHNLGFKVTAEGVESQHIYDMLEAQTCDLCQGYYISHPLPEHEMHRFIRESTWTGASAISLYSNNK